MLKVGLTGSIAVGKSFVLGVLAKLGAHVIDADLIARAVVLPGTPGLQMIRDSFGDDILDGEGGLDRAKLGAVVFSDESKRKQLNAILHPLIIAEQDRCIQEFARKDPDGLVVIDAALMIESGGYRRLDKLVVVHCRPEIQLARLMKRNHLSREAAEQRINSQMSQDEKKKFADYLIDTSGDFESTKAQVESLFEKLRKDVRQDLQD